MSEEISLDDLRREIDAIDDNIHDLIMRRTKVVEQVREAKRGQKVKIRPARECQILYRLNERHKGPFPKRELARIWRELIVATLSFEGPFAVGVHMPEEPNLGEPRTDRRTGRWNMARDQYGSFTPMSVFPSASRLVNAVRANDVTVGILGLPERKEDKPWWIHLASSNADTPRIITRLPFIGGPTDRSNHEEALVICSVAPEPTGRDRTYIVVETGVETGLERLSTAVKQASMESVFSSFWHDPERPSRHLYLVEVDGFIADGDSRLNRLSECLDGSASAILTIGSYGLPLTPEQLQTNK